MKAHDALDLYDPDGEREPGSDDDDETPVMDFDELRREEDERALAARLLAERRAPADRGGEPPTPLDRPRVPSFPVAALPSPLREFVVATAEAIQVPTDVPALLVLAAVAACVQRRYVVEVRDGYLEPLSLYVAVILDSGERKSACLSAITKPLADWERAEADRLADVIAQELSRRAIALKRKEHLEGQAAKAKEPDERRALSSEAAEIARELSATPEPVFPRVLADDVTPEALGRLMAAHGERMSVFSAEGGIFETIAGRYSNGTPNLDVFLKGHAADLLRIDRRSGPPVVMNAPALTMGLAVQPDVLHALADKPGFRGRGLLARWFFGMPASRVGYRRVSAAAVPAYVTEAYAAAIRQMLDGPSHAVQAGEVVPIRLSPAASDARDRLAGELEARMRPGAELAQVKDWAGKAAGLAVRLAGIMHLAAGGVGAVTEAITEDTMRAAVTIVDAYAIPHALVAFGEMGADPELDAARAAIEWIRGRDLQEVSVRDVFNGLRGQARFAKTEAVQRALDVAEQYGHLRRLPCPPKRGAGRARSPRYAVLTAESQGPQNAHNSQNLLGGPDSADSADFAGEQGGQEGAP